MVLNYIFQHNYKSDIWNYPLNMLKFSNVIFVYKKLWKMIMNDAKIFLLDDKQEIINMIEPALRKEGYENIFSANNITTAEKQLKK